MLDRSNLLLDVGNTSIKYAWYTFPAPIADLQVLRTTIDNLDSLLEQASHCWLCSVLDDVSNREIADLCVQAKVIFHQVNTQARQFDIQNAYAVPSNMGSDRWMAIIAGAALCDKGEQNNYIVIDSGTAITCDFVVANKHIGGWIAPGLSLARESVVKQTSRVFDQAQVISSLTVGDDTPQCVALGALAQLSGMLLQAINIMQQQSDKFDIFMSGGDAPTLIHSHCELVAQSAGKLASKNINYLENLVLVGLAKIAHENIALNA